VIDERFTAMGCDCRILAEGRDARAAVAAARAAIHDADRTLSRFAATSELARLNADLRSRVPASPLVCTAVAAAIAAAVRSGGLCDPTVLAALASSGYDERWDPARRIDLRAALDAAPVRRPARPARLPAWRQVFVDPVAGVVQRPPGVWLDLGATAKGLAADLAAGALRMTRRALVDCGGDIRVVGEAPYRILVPHPLETRPIGILELGAGAVATSGIDRRIWRGRDGRPAHHLIDPSTGQPAWTGIVMATAIGEDGVDAETRASTALLSGQEGARRMLAELGGLLVDEAGGVEAVGPFAGVAQAATA
jgi:thiamine biosynthesis lipoprotein